MAIIRNAANTLMKGRVGQTTYYISKGQQVARQSRNDSNYGETARRTELQQYRRVLWANLVQFYKISARWMPKAFESKRPGQTDYNKFMAVNVPSARIPLTKSQAEAGACVVDGFLVSQGSLPSIEVTQVVNAWKTNLFVGALTINNSTTVAALTEALIDNNANIREGMQLSFASYQQMVDPLGTPRVNCRLYEITLTSTDTTYVRAHIPAIGSTVVDGAIGTSEDVSTGGFAWILSELQNGTLRTSTQLLTVNNTTLIAQMTSAAQLRAAAESYGIDSEVILNPATTVSQTVEPINAYIQYIEVNDIRFNPGVYFGRADRAYGQDITIKFSENIEGMITGATTTKGLSQVYESAATIVSQTGDVAVIRGTFTDPDGNILTKITVTFIDSTQVNIEFASEQQDMG